MDQPEKSPESMRQEIDLLRNQVVNLTRRCAEAEEALDAIRRGAVDAFVVYSEEGEKVYTFEGADYLYRVLVESIYEGAATIIEDGTILYCNQRFAEMLKAPLETIIASSIFLHITPDCRAKFSALLHEGLVESCRDEIRLLCKDGSNIPVMVSLNKFNASGTAGICLVASDLSERKKIEELTRKQAITSGTLFEISRSLAEAGLDNQAIMKIVAHSMAKLTGDACIIHLYSSDGRQVDSTAHFHPDPGVDQCLEEFTLIPRIDTDKSLNGQVLRTGEALLLQVPTVKSLKFAFKAELLDLVKSLKATGLLIVPIRSQDKTIGTMMMIRMAAGKTYDLDDQNLAQRIANQMALAITNARLYKDLQVGLEKEKTMLMQLVQAEKLSALSRMMASVVHEINNPVQTIKNCLYLVKSELPEDSPYNTFLSMATNETDRIGKLVSNLRDIYRSPKTELIRPLDLWKILSDVQSLLGSHLSYQNIAWQQIYPDEAIWVYGTADQLKQVFLNITLNAIEAMQPGGGLVSVTASVDHEKNEVAVAVRDTGPGIEPENLAKVFEPFFTTKPKGTGLGLMICYEIVKRHNGVINAESRPGEGATFTVRLPLITAPLNA